MRGSDERSGSLFSYVDLEARVRADHPLRVIRSLANAALVDLSVEFDKLYTDFGRLSIAPEKLLRAMLLQVFYGVRSERHLMERMEFDLLFRWFVGLGVDDAVWDHSTFSKNRDRLLEGDIAAKFLNALLAQPQVKHLLSSDHFSVDGTLIEAWASIKTGGRMVATKIMTVRDAMPNAASTRRGDPTRPMRARPIQRPGSIRRATASRPSSAIWDMR
jgi:transposase